MFRVPVTEKNLCFIPALLLVSQIFYRILFLQTVGCNESNVFAVIPSTFAAFTIGIFFRRVNLRKQSRFLLHSILFALLVFSTLIQPIHFYGAELIVLCILAGLVFASVPDAKKIIPVVIAGTIAASLLFSPSSQLIRYLNFILLPFAQFCLLCAYFVTNIPSRRKLLTGIPLLLSLTVLILVTWSLMSSRTVRRDVNLFQLIHQHHHVQSDHQFLSLLSLLCQEKRTAENPIRITVIENEPLYISRLLEPLKKYGFPMEVEYFYVDFTQNSQRLLPVMRPHGITPAEVPFFIGKADLVIVAPPRPTERSGAFLSSATFFRQIMDKLPHHGMLAVYAYGSEDENKTIHNSMPAPVKDKNGNLNSGTLHLRTSNFSLFLARRDGQKIDLDGKRLSANLPVALAGYRDALELVFPSLTSENTDPQNADRANRPFHSELLQKKHPPAQGGFFRMLINWHGLVIAGLIGLFLLLRYFVSWKPIHKPCFQAFEAGLLTMLMLAGAVIVGASMGCGPFFSLIPTITAVFCLTFLFVEIVSTREQWAKYSIVPLILVILLFLLGWNLPSAVAMVAALALKTFLKRETPELMPAQKVYPRIWLLTGMSVALVMAGLFLILPI